MNKIFFSRAERSRGESLRRLWRIRSWVVYLTGLPAWVVAFVREHNWIAAGVESGGAPAMMVGLIIAWKGRGSEPKYLDYIAQFAILIGFIISIYDFGGIRTVTQFFELGIAAGFLMGTYLMAKDESQGYFWLMLGNISCASLMGMQGLFIFMAQQMLSLVFVIDAYLVRRKKCMKKADFFETNEL